MNRRFFAISLGLAALAASFGCMTSPSRSPQYTKPPEIHPRAAWSRRLPGGSYRAQQPAKLGLLVTANKLDDLNAVAEFLKEEEKRAWADTHSSQVAYHYYIDGAGNIYQGRALNCQGPAVAGHDPDGMVWIAFMNSDFDLYGVEEAREKVIHLLTYLCFTYDLPHDQIVVECQSGVEDSRLCKDLKGTYVQSRIELALDQTMKALDENPTAYMHVRTQQLRTNPSAD